MSEAEDRDPKDAKPVALRSRVYAIAMIVFPCLDLWFRLRHLSTRFAVPAHLPYDSFSFFSDRTRWVTSLLVDLFILYIVAAGFVPGASSRAERNTYLALFVILVIPPLRYFLPSVAAPLWWAEVVGLAVLVVAAVILLAEILWERQPQ
jgi:hypothetical protein